MHGSALIKTARLARDLLTKPKYLTRYLHHNVLKKHTPFELELPWFPYEAIDFLESHVRPHMSVLEFGSGGSTLFFSKRARYVHSVEDSYFWWSKISASLRARNILNVRIELQPFDFEKPADILKSDYLSGIPKFPFDLIVIDGSEEWISVRPQQYFYLEKLIQPGGIILVDDSWRYPEIDSHSKAKQIRVFQSAGPCRPGVTRATAYCF